MANDLPSPISSLGFDNKKHYEEWCSENGFNPSIRKSSVQLKAEKKYIEKQRFSYYIKQSNPKNMVYIIQCLRNGDQVLNDLQNIYDNLKRKWPHLIELFLEVLEFLNKKSRILQDFKIVKHIVSILYWKDEWIRDYKDWKPNTYNPERQLASFARHLFAKYEVPHFMDYVWGLGDLCNEQEWYIHIGKGQNIRTAQNLPFSLTKMEAHHFMSAPMNYNVYEAFCWGQIKALGGSPRLIETLRGSQIIPPANQLRASSLKTSEYNNFRQSVVRFLIQNPMLDPAQINPMIDYIWNQKYTHQRVFIDHQLTTLPPPQPNFSMNGRNVEALLAQVERWHNQLGKERKGGDVDWEHSHIPDFKYEDGGNRRWFITELLSSKELTAEGRAMSHCVASYAYSCKNGQCSIWSLSVDSKSISERLVTIELRNGTLYQMRGRLNRFPNQQEMSIIRRWCQKEGLKISSSTGY
jgi:hypothetical protein